MSVQFKNNTYSEYSNYRFIDLLESDVVVGTNQKSPFSDLTHLLESNKIILLSKDDTIFVLSKITQRLSGTITITVAPGSSNGSTTVDGDEYSLEEFIEKIKDGSFRVLMKEDPVKKNESKDFPSKIKINYHECKELISSMSDCDFLEFINSNDLLFKHDNKLYRAGFIENVNPLMDEPVIVHFFETSNKSLEPTRSILNRVMKDLITHGEMKVYIKGNVEVLEPPVPEVIHSDLHAKLEYVSGISIGTKLCHDDIYKQLIEMETNKPGIISRWHAQNLLKILETSLRRKVGLPSPMDIDISLATPEFWTWGSLIAVRPFCKKSSMSIKDVENALPNVHATKSGIAMTRLSRNDISISSLNHIESTSQKDFDQYFQSLVATQTFFNHKNKTKHNLDYFFSPS